MNDRLSRRQVLTGAIAVTAAAILPAQPVVDAGQLIFGPLDPVIRGQKPWIGVYNKMGELLASSVEVEVKAIDGGGVIFNAPAIDIWQTGVMEVRINRGKHAVFILDKPVAVVSGDSLVIRDLKIELT